MSNIEQLRPKLRYRMQRELLEGLRTWADKEGITVTAVLTLLAQGLLDGRIRIDAHDAVEERREDLVPDWAQPPADLEESA